MSGFETEKSRFQDQKLLPFSKEMRRVAIAYLVVFKESEPPIEKAYANAIDWCTQQRNVEFAQVLTNDKKQLLAPKLAGVMQFISTEGQGFFSRSTTQTEMLYMNGTTDNGKKWLLESQRFIIHSQQSYTLTPRPDGITFNVTGAGPKTTATLGSSQRRSGGGFGPGFGSPAQK